MQTKAIVQSLHYLIKHYAKNDIANTMAIVKLFFFAQRYHLRKYARLIANDKMIAMKNGPVSSLALDLMKGKYHQILEDDKEFAKKYLQKFDNYLVKALSDESEYEELSQSDIEALDFALENYKHLDEWELVNQTHQYDEWSKHKNNPNAFMDYLDFFGDNPPNSPDENITKTQLKLNKEWFMGKFE